MAPAVLRTLRAPPDAGTGTETSRRRALPLWAAVAAVIAFVLLASQLSWQRWAIRSLPEVQRAEALSRTVDDLRRMCGDPQPTALRAHCRELASFAAQFAECKGECEALVRRELAPNPTR